MADTDNDGASNLSEFLAGTSPVDAGDVLTLSIENRGGSIWINWNTRPGLLYEIQHSPDMKTWNRYGVTRFAPDRTDQLHVNDGSEGVFRIVRIR
jgi:hypothetical protein